MILTKEDYDGLVQMQALLSRIIRNAVYSEIEEENEQKFAKIIIHPHSGWYFIFGQ